MEVQGGGKKMPKVNCTRILVVFVICSLILAMRCGQNFGFLGWMYLQFSPDTSISREGVAVNVSVYFESYCPDSIRFITKVLYPAYQALNSTGIMNLHLIPFGKAEWTEKANGMFDFKCQHGDKECVGNTYEACIIHHSKHDETIYLPVIQCIEAATTHDPHQCVEESALDWATIQQCGEGKEGNTLLWEYGVKTHALGELKYIPRIHINNEFTEMLSRRSELHLLSVVCDTYQGERPFNCP